MLTGVAVNTGADCRGLGGEGKRGKVPMTLLVERGDGLQQLVRSCGEATELQLLRKDCNATARLVNGVRSL